MNSTSKETVPDNQPVLKAGSIKKIIDVTVFPSLRAVILFVAVFAWPFSLQAGSVKIQSRAQTVKLISTSVDSVSLVHLLDSLIIPGLAKYHIPGMLIAIVHDSEIVLTKGYGYADIERKIPFDPDSTVIRIASVSKLITGTAVMQLVDQGVLDMHQDVNSYLTRFKVESWPGKPMTLHHLLTHTAGIDDRTIGKSAWTQEGQIPLGDFLAARFPRRICPPGEVYMYSNFSNALAGFVIEQVMREDYAASVRRSILEPLGMKQSDYRLRPDLQPLLAQGYSHAGAGFQLNRFDFINDYPGGQMLSTAKDMAKFMIAHLQLGRYEGKRILSEESAAAMHTVQFTHQKELEHAVGYIVGILPARSQTILMHDGGYTGIGCRLCLCPESRIGFFVACNIMDGVLLGKVSRKILDLVIPEPPQDSTKYPLTPIPQYDKNIAAFAGTYRLSRYVHNDITKMGVLLGMSGPEMSIGKNDEGMILMDTYTGRPRRMIQIQPCLFRSIDDRYKCAFRWDASGTVTHLFMDGTTAFEKIPWYETTIFQRSLLGVCLLYFVLVSLVLPIIRKIRKMQKPSGLSADPVRWFAQKTTTTFLVYVLGLGFVAGFVVPQKELVLGFVHGIHWTAYIVQTIGLLGILFLAGLLGILFWRPVMSSDTKMGERVQPGGLGLVTALIGSVFVWFLWYWNLIGYQF
ncbi:MAG: class A beta-lactamase-related serine hydrolase [Ignavibacteriae bacterium]|nr:MAG: class A beta-lactamase-related serine hydrolase [Ignavibacteriota bacterium]